MKDQKPSFFQITAIIITVILFVFIIISIGVIIDLKHKTDKTKEKNDQITNSFFIEENYSSVQQNYINNIKNL